MSNSTGTTTAAQSQQTGGHKPVPKTFVSPALATLALFYLSLNQARAKTAAS